MVKLIKDKVLQMEKKKVILNYFIIGLILLVVILIGFTYAYWNVSIKQTGENIVNTACLEVAMEQEGTPISLGTTFPIEDTEGEKLQPFQFTIHNKCDDNANYQINLESMSKNGENVIEEENRLNPKYLKFKLNEVGKSGKVGLLTGEKGTDTTKVDKTIKDAYESHKLMSGYLAPNEEKNFEFRLWMDGETTIENADAMDKTFLSKISVISTYLSEDKIVPTVELALSVCDGTITAQATATAFKGRSISKYEYQIDNNEWQNGSTNETFKFSSQTEGNHTVKVRVTDNMNKVSEEVSKEINYSEPTSVNLLGKDLSLVTQGNGLYKVSHCDVTDTVDDEGFSHEEYRFAGVNYKDNNTSYVHNYVNFNEEIWRIIGLVNVKTEAGKYEQRLKIVRTDGVGNQKNFGSYYWDTSNNDWTTSKLKAMLNSSYYNSTSGDCYTNSSTATQCDFNSESGTLPKGLDETAQGMVDDGVTWNLGGTATYTSATNGLVTNWYNYERGTTVPSSHQTEWTKVNDRTNHKGVGLIYPSDYGYATNGGSKGREDCFKTALYNWDTESYQTNCANNDWLKPSSSYLWTITPLSGGSYSAFGVSSLGYVNNNFYVYHSSVVWPVVYLKSNIQISDGEGTFEKPYNLVSGAG